MKKRLKALHPHLLVLGEAVQHLLEGLGLHQPAGRGRDRVQGRLVLPHQCLGEGLAVNYVLRIYGNVLLCCVEKKREGVISAYAIAAMVPC